MTGAAVAGFKRGVADREKERLVRAAVGIVAAEARTGTRPYSLVGAVKARGGSVVAAGAEVPQRILDHGWSVGAVRVVALRALLAGRLVRHPGLPETRDVLMAGEAQGRLLVQEQVCPGGAVCQVAGPAVELFHGVMCDIPLFQGVGKGPVAVEADFP